MKQLLSGIDLSGSQPLNTFEHSGDVGVVFVQKYWTKILPASMGAIVLFLSLVTLIGPREMAANCLWP